MIVGFVVVASDGAKHASSGGMVMLKPPVSSLQALSPIPYRYEDDVGMPEGMYLFIGYFGCLFTDVRRAFVFFLRHMIGFSMLDTNTFYRFLSCGFSNVVCACKSDWLLKVLIRQ